MLLPPSQPGRGKGMMLQYSMHKDIEAYWRELFAAQLESLIYMAPTDTSFEAKWFDEGMQHAIMMLRHTRSDDYPPELST